MNAIHQNKYLPWVQDQREGGIHKHDRQAHSKYPHCLECPEGQEPQGVGSLVVKPVILPDLDDSVEEVAGEPQPPEDDADGDGDLSPVVLLSQDQGQDCEDNKISSTSKICHLKINQEMKGRQFVQNRNWSNLVKFKSASNKKEGELHSNCDNSAYC